VGTSRSEPRLVRRYVALGDSFTAGAPGGEPEGRWPDELAAALRSVNPDLEYHNL
jgi:lysophospholipase L1-like esterase